MLRKWTIYRRCSPDWIKRVLYVLVLGLLSFPGFVLSATYYLDTTSSVEPKTGTAQQPWTSFTEAQQSLLPGDTLCCSGNLGDIVISNSDPIGTPTQWIKYQNWEGKPTPLFQSLTFDYSSDRNGYLSFQKIRFVPGFLSVGKSTVLLNYASHIEFKYCQFEGAKVLGRTGNFEPYCFANTSLVASGWKGIPTNVIISNCSFLYGYNGIRIVNGHSWVIERNVISEFADNGIQIGNGGGGNTVISDNIIHHGNKNRGHYYWSGTATGNWSGKTGQIAVQDSTGATGIFDEIADGRFHIYANDRNRIPSRTTSNLWRLSTNPAIFFTPSGTGDDCHTDLISIEGGVAGVQIQRNILTLSTGQALKFGMQGGTCTNIRVTNNLFYDPNPGTYMCLFETGEIYFANNVVDAGNAYPARAIRALGNAPLQLSLFNNIISGAVYSNGTITSDNNIWRIAPHSSFNEGPNSEILPNFDSLFVNRSAGNYLYSGNSIAKNQGNAAYAPQDDFFGRTRPYGPKPDVGFYEANPEDQTVHTIGNKTAILGDLVSFNIVENPVASTKIWAFNLPEGAQLVNEQFSWTPVLEGVYPMTFAVKTASGNGINVETITVTIVNPNLGSKAHWKLNETAGTQAADASGNNQTAILINGTQWDDRSVKTDGIDDYINAGTGTFDLTQEVTISLWFSPGNLAGQQSLVQRGIWAYPFTLSLNGNTIRTCVRTADGTDWLNANTLIQPSQWYHLALTYKSGERIVYINGVRDITDPTPPTGNLVVTSGLRTTIANNGNGGGYFQGYIDDVRIYNHALSAVEIRDVYLTSDGQENWLSHVNLLPYDLAGNTVSFSPVVAGLPKRAAFNPGTNALSWRPWYDQAGSYELLFSTVGGDYTQKVTIDVENVLLKAWYQDWINDPDTLSAMVDY